MINTKCYCISLRENEQIRIDLTKDLNQIGLDVEYHIVDRSPLGGIHGCFTSHVDVLKKGLTQQCKYIMVLEDDVYFKLPHDRIFNKINTYIDQLDHTNWCFCFGYFTECPAVKVNAWINKLYHCYCTHAYVVPRQTAKSLIKMQWSGQPVDHQWKDHISTFHVPYPMIAFQKDHKSTISN